MAAHAPSVRSRADDAERVLEGLALDEAQVLDVEAAAAVPADLARAARERAVSAQSARGGWVVARKGRGKGNGVWARREMGNEAGK